MLSIAIADTVEAFADFTALVDEYETSLPTELRHMSWSDERERVAATYGSPNAAIVAKDETGTLGCVALVRHDAAAGVIKKLFVRPRGRGNGAGRALMHAAVEEARRRGCSTLLLDTDRERLGAAYRLYVSLGFRECEPFATVDYRCATFMRLKLD